MRLETRLNFGFGLKLVAFLLGLSALAVVYFDWRADGRLSILGWLFALGFCLIIYGIFVGPRRLSVKRFREKLVAEPKAWIRVVLMSDFHAGVSRAPAWYERLAIEAQALDPDVLLLGGDYVNGDATRIHDLKAMSGVTARLGRYFVLGNHDFLDDPGAVRETLRAWGLVDLTNAHTTLRKDGRELQLSALDDHWHGRPSIPPLRASHQMPHLTLAHEPDAVLDFEENDTDLILAGNTHGGQVRLPLIGALMPIPAKLGRKVDRGRKMIRGIPMIISAGCGESDFGARLFCPPEITVIEVGI
jgi:predicted MPP superfamily phosphohydrolase